MGASLVTAEAGLNALRKALDNRGDKHISKDNLLKMESGEVCFKKQLR